MTESFMKLLHKKMFCNVWKWAGEFRRSEKNIGVPWYSIPALTTDTQAQAKTVPGN